MVRYESSDTRLLAQRWSPYPVRVAEPTRSSFPMTFHHVGTRRPTWHLACRSCVVMRVIRLQGGLSEGERKETSAMWYDFLKFKGMQQ